MILSGLQAVAAILVPSSGIARGRPQRVRSATKRLVANSHGLVIGPGGLRRSRLATTAARVATIVGTRALSARRSPRLGARRAVHHGLRRDGS